MDEVIAYLQRIEAKLDALIDALAEDDVELPVVDLEGLRAGLPRDPDQAL